MVLCVIEVPRFPVVGCGSNVQNLHCRGCCSRPVVESPLHSRRRPPFVSSCTRDDSRTDEPRSLPHLSFFLFKDSTLSCCTESEGSHGVRIQMNLLQQQPVRSLFPCLFPIHMTAHCRQQCPSCTPCQECKAQQLYQNLFCGVVTPSLTPARRGR